MGPGTPCPYYFRCGGLKKVGLRFRGSGGDKTFGGKTTAMPVYCKSSDGREGRRTGKSIENTTEEEKGSLQEPRVLIRRESLLRGEIHTGRDIPEYHREEKHLYSDATNDNVFVKSRETGRIKVAILIPHNQGEPGENG